ncbi:hypothetical protein [Actinorugispora endophytica]|uniref:hypothetical protein n=1 Tax=Actinorugispora endophytica TaxID=1605990 RepID=UPI001AAC9A79|nr:hypothetical protein [Actinorugispora endophytica]
MTNETESNTVSDRKPSGAGVASSWEGCSFGRVSRVSFVSSVSRVLLLSRASVVSWEVSEEVWVVVCWGVPLTEVTGAGGWSVGFSVPVPVPVPVLVSPVSDVVSTGAGAVPVSVPVVLSVPPDRFWFWGVPVCWMFPVVLPLLLVEGAVAGAVAVGGWKGEAVSVAGSASGPGEASWMSWREKTSTGLWSDSGNPARGSGFPDREPKRFSMNES